MANAKTKLAASQSMVQRNRKLTGDKFEKEMDRKLTAAGLPGYKKIVTGSLAGKQYRFECDHFIETLLGNIWIESTIFLDTRRAMEFIEKRKEVEATGFKVDRWIILYKEGPGQKSRKNVKSYIKMLESNGWFVMNGINEIDTFIQATAEYSTSIGVNENGNIRVPKLMHIPFENIITNETNRDIHDKSREKDLLNLCKCIVKYGFLTQLNVVPETVNGIPTGRYKLVEGHCRHHAAFELLKKFYGKHLEGGALPCIVIDWVTTEEPEKVHEIMILLNTTTRPWNVENYVNSHYKAAKQINAEEKFFSYGTLKWMYKTADENNFKHSKLLYILGPVADANTAASKWIDRDQIKEGRYRITKDQVENKMKPFVENHLIPFVKWHMASRNYDASKTTVADVFMKEMFYHYLNGSITDKQINDNTDAFKKIKKADMPLDANEEGMEKLHSLLKHIRSQKNTTTLNVKSPVKKVNKTKV